MWYIQSGTACKASVAEKPLVELYSAIADEIDTFLF